MIWLFSLVAWVRVVPRRLLLVIVTDVSKTSADVIIRVTWRVVSCQFPDWPIFSWRIKLCKLVVIGKFRSLAVGVKLSRSLRFACWGNCYHFLPFCTHSSGKTLLRKSMNHENWTLEIHRKPLFYSWSLNYTYQETCTDLEEIIGWNPFPFFLMVIRIQKYKS